MKQTSEVRRLPISNRLRIGGVLFLAALLSAGFYVFEITWLNFAYSLAFAAALGVLWFARYRGQPLMSEATRKTTTIHVERRGGPVTIEMVGTPKYPRPSSREKFAGVAAAGLFLLVWWLLPGYWSRLMQFASDQVWPFFGFLLWSFFLSIYLALRAPKRSSRVHSSSETSH